MNGPLNHLYLMSAGENACPEPKVVHQLWIGVLQGHLHEVGVKGHFGVIPASLGGFAIPCTRQVTCIDVVGLIAEQLEDPEEQETAIYSSLLAVHELIK